jgi:3-hydroxyacyl-CoA dehydrogenase
VPGIADDIVNVDRAMRWGYAWKMGPFELLDAVGPARVAERLGGEGRPVPRMLALALKASPQAFYAEGGKQYLGTDGRFHPVPGAG